MKNLDVSLVICTRNRAAQLKVCLQYVAHQQPSCNWELIVVYTDANAETSKFLTEYAAAVPFPAIVLSEDMPGLGRARNTGWKAARGEIIAFTDDDCYVAADYIDKVREAFNDIKVGFAGGRINLFDPSDYPITIRTDNELKLTEPRSAIEPGAMQGANMMFRRRVLEAVGGFDPYFGAGTRFGGEDVDAQARASFAGWWGLYTPEVVVAHHHRRTAKDLPALNRYYALGRGAYIAKHLLIRETRPAFLRQWYWGVRLKMCGSWSYRYQIVWEVLGAIGYLVDRLCSRP